MTTTTAPLDLADALHLPMPTRALPGLGHRASRLTLGGVKWDSQIPEADAIDLIHRAIDLGVNTFDTAPVYGGGKSETRLGKALAGRRDRFWITTKTIQRGYDDAKRDIEGSLDRLATDTIDLLLVHGVDNDDDADKILDPNGVLKAIEAFRDAGHIKHVGVPGHHYKHNMTRVIEACDFEAVLLPAGIFNEAYSYSYLREVVPVARRRGLTVMGMKIMGAGRAKHTADPSVYLRYALGQDIDTAVVGCESIAQLEHNVAVVKSKAQPPTAAEVEALFPEAKRVTESWDAGEFNWVGHYTR